MTNKLEQIRTVCTKNSQLSKLAQRTQQLSKLNYILQQAMPPQFSAHCQLANVREQTLVVHTDNASYASLLRFQANTLCAALSEYLPQPVTKLEVKVRPRYETIKSEGTSSISLPMGAADALTQTAEEMEEGPLKVALQKLAKRRKK
ncbi:MAG: DUF721 domain-containing protein [Gammaproteobacteria bacterium]|nr:DUF721 domain-containing protein [Gammaproteobacteria bacterium]